MPEIGRKIENKISQVRRKKMKKGSNRRTWSGLHYIGDVGYMQSIDPTTQITDLK